MSSDSFSNEIRLKEAFDWPSSTAIFVGEILLEGRCDFIATMLKLRQSILQKTNFLISKTFIFLRK